MGETTEKLKELRSHLKLLDDTLRVLGDKVDDACQEALKLAHVSMEGAPEAAIPNTVPSAANEDVMQTLSLHSLALLSQPESELKETARFLGNLCFKLISERLMMDKLVEQQNEINQGMRLQLIKALIPQKINIRRMFPLL